MTALQPTCLQHVVAFHQEITANPRHGLRDFLELSTVIEAVSGALPFSVRDVYVDLVRNYTQMHSGLAQGLGSLSRPMLFFIVQAVTSMRQGVLEADAVARLEAHVNAMQQLAFVQHLDDFQQRCTDDLTKAFLALSERAISPERVRSLKQRQWELSRSIDDASNSINIRLIQEVTELAVVKRELREIYSRVGTEEEGAISSIDALCKAAFRALQSVHHAVASLTSSTQLVTSDSDCLVLASRHASLLLQFVDVVCGTSLLQEALNGST